MLNIFWNGKIRARKEKKIARIARKNVGSTYSHVMVQGINKESIFNNGRDKQKYYYYINKIKQQYDILIISYCIMPNHSHFLIKSTNTDELSGFMQKINTKYAMYYNSINNRVGYVFRDRFKLQEITSIEHFYRCVEYIHDNPIKAGMCTKQSEYKYSSFSTMYNCNRDELYARLNDIIKDNVLDNSEKPIDFLEDEVCYKGCEDSIIEEVLRNNKITKYELVGKENQEKLRKIIKILRNEYKIPYRKIGEKLGISREKIRKLNIN